MGWCGECGCFVYVGVKGRHACGDVWMPCLRMDWWGDRRYHRIIRLCYYKKTPHYIHPRTLTYICLAHLFALFLLPNFTLNRKQKQEEE